MREGLGNRNILLLSLCEMLFVGTLSIGNTLVGLVSMTLVSDKSLATVPYAVMTAMAAASTIGASFLMQRVGRRWGFVFGAFTCVVAGVMCLSGIYAGQFWIFCLGYGLVGTFKAFAQYYRFAAADTPFEREKTMAVSLTLAGGLFGALGGPLLGASSRDLLAPVQFAGSFLTIGALGVVSLLLASGLNFRSSSSKTAEPAGTGRPLAVIAKQPAFKAAIINAAIGYGAMAGIMIASPLAIVAEGYPPGYAAIVMQWHLVGMYGPSFFTGKLIQRFGTSRVMYAGALSFVASVMVALAGRTMPYFCAALFLCGIGWNFIYVGSTILLTSTYRPEEKAKVQAANEFVLFCVVTVVSLATGVIFAGLGWTALNLCALPLIAMSVLALFASESGKWRQLPSGADPDAAAAILPREELAR